MRFSRRLAAGAASLVLAAGLTACSSDSGESSASGVDCEAANAALIDYSAALTQFVGGLTEGNEDDARSGATAFVAAAQAIPRALPGVSNAAESFVTVSEDAGRFIEDALSDGIDSQEILDELNVIFGSEEFSTGGDAIDDFFREQCPDQANPS